MTVWKARVTTVGNYLRSHSGIPSIQHDGTRRLVTPKPYVIDVTSARGLAPLMNMAWERLKDGGFWAVIKHTKDRPVDEALVIVPLRVFAELLGAHYERRHEGRKDGTA